jgi:hypothetical protein
MSVRAFALTAGILYIGAGILGFIPGITSAPPTGAPSLAVDSNYGYLLGLFPVNVLHNFVHLGIGTWGLIASANIQRSRVFAASVAVVYGLLAVMGVFPALHTLFGLVPLFGHDIWLHTATAVFAAYFGFLASPEVVVQRRANIRTDKVKVYEEHPRL